MLNPIYILLLLPLALSGCGPREAVVETSSLLEIQAQSGLNLPSTAQILAADDGGGRVGGYFEWVIYSASPREVAIPPPGTNTGACVTNTTAVAVKAVERIAKKRIPDAFIAFSSNWESNGLEFQATVVKTPNGDYLYLRRFPKAH